MTCHLLEQQQKSNMYAKVNRGNKVKCWELWEICTIDCFYRLRFFLLLNLCCYELRCFVADKIGSTIHLHYKMKRSTLYIEIKRIQSQRRYTGMNANSWCYLMWNRTEKSICCDYDFEYRLDKISDRYPIHWRNTLSRQIGCVGENEVVNWRANSRTHETERAGKR